MKFSKILFIVIFVICFTQAFDFRFEHRQPIETEECFSRGQYNIKIIQEKIILFQKIHFILSLQDEYLYENRWIKDNNIKQYNQIYIGLKNIQLKDNIFEMRLLKYDFEPKDLQVIAFYQYLKELKQKLQYLQKIIDGSSEFFNGFEKQKQIIVNNYKQIQSQIQIYRQYDKEDLEQELKQLYRDAQICDSRRYYNLNIFNDQSFKTNIKKSKQKNRSMRGNKKKGNELLQTQTKYKWKFQQKPEIDENSCKLYKSQIIQEYKELLIIQETLIFISRSQVTDEIINKLLNLQNQFQMDKKIINDYLGSIKITYINEELINNLNQIEKYNQEIDISISETDEGQQVDILIQNIFQLDKQSKLLNEQIISVKPLLTDGDRFIFEIGELNNKIRLIQANYQYQPNEIYKYLIQLDRDYKICQGQENFEIVKDIQVPKNTHFQEVRDTVEITPSIDQKECPNLLPKIKDKIFLNLKFQILNQLYYTSAYSETITYLAKGFGEQIVKYRKRNYHYTPLNQYMIQLKGNKLVKFKRYSINYKPDDIKAVNAYHSLDILNNKLWQIQYYFDQAKNFMKYKEFDFKKFLKNFEDINEAISQASTSKEHWGIISKIVLQQEIKEQLRDHRVCTGEDLVLEDNININLKQLQQLQQSKQIITINQSTKITVKNKKKLKTNPFSKKSQNSHYQFLHEDQIQHSSSLLQVRGDWKYFDYAPIEKDQCKGEIEIIKEDILQFLKIQTLFIYQREYQKTYNAIIQSFLQIQNEFLEDADFIKQKMNLLNIESFILVFDYPKYQYQSDPVEIAFNKFQSFNTELIQFKNDFVNAKSLLNLNQDDFASLRYNQYILNEYLDKKFRYQPLEVEKEIEQLYRDYFICTEKQYLSEPDDVKRINHYILLQNKQNRKQKKNSK